MNVYLVPLPFTFLILMTVQFCTFILHILDPDDYEILYLHLSHS